MRTLKEAVDQYSNSAEGNDAMWEQFTALTDSDTILKQHRDYVEANKLGYGDRAFHYMWKLLLEDIRARSEKARLLEIGVYKGQSICLWSLLAPRIGLEAEIHAVTPLEGNEPKRKLMNIKLARSIRKRVDRRYREMRRVGNLYDIDDYESIIRNFFAAFDLSFHDIVLHRGYSTDEKILGEVKGLEFDMIYIDGDHSFEVVTADINNYAPLIAPGGYLVMDDASFFLEGTVFWKGHKEVSEACRIIEGLGFENILNVGHNRVYRRIDAPTGL